MVKKSIVFTAAMRVYIFRHALADFNAAPMGGDGSVEKIVLVGRRKRVWP